MRREPDRAGRKHPCHEPARRQGRALGEESFDRPARGAALILNLDLGAGRD